MYWLNRKKLRVLPNQTAFDAIKANNINTQSDLISNPTLQQSDTRQAWIER